MEKEYRYYRVVCAGTNGAVKPTVEEAWASWERMQRCDACDLGTRQAATSARLIVARSRRAAREASIGSCGSWMGEAWKVN